MQKTSPVGKNKRTQGADQKITNEVTRKNDTPKSPFIQGKMTKGVDFKIVILELFVYHFDVKQPVSIHLRLGNAAIKFQMVFHNSWPRINGVIGSIIDQPFLAYKGDMPMKKIACCTDFSENAEAAFVTALDMAEKYGAKLSVIHVLPQVVNPMLADAEWVFPVESKKSMIMELEDRMQKEYSSRISDSIDSELVVLDGHVSSEVITYLVENRVDLVVTGSYGLSGVGLVVFGSVAKRLAHRAPCSVLIVRLQKDSPEDS